ncbi:hypothetical protein CBOM_06261 [Ceraceosorus bombacis]|uniref:Uncharacterized protein n=1 Tax=Ceraceosorus bombacis TaxID=401625 RepID=A0A0P1BKB5_9BASI|nr:hypothetical protein CBOM_06261 [Ceraceosorus bombacis]
MSSSTIQALLILVLLAAARIDCRSVAPLAAQSSVALVRRTPTPNEKENLKHFLPAGSSSFSSQDSSTFKSDDSSKYSSEGSSSFKSDGSMSSSNSKGFASPRTPLKPNALKRKSSALAFPGILEEPHPTGGVEHPASLQPHKELDTLKDEGQWKVHSDEEWVPHSMPKGYHLQEFRLAGSYYAATPDGGLRYIPSRDTAVHEKEKMPGERLYGKLRGGILMTKAQGKGYTRSPYHRHMFLEEMAGKEFYPHDVLKGVQLLRPARK